MAALISLLDFLPPSTVTGNNSNIFAAIPPLPPHCHQCIISGPERTGKTTLLFHAAFNLASRGQQSILFITSRNAIQHSPPALAPGLTPEHPAWKNVHMKYLETAHDLLRLFALIHNLPAPPTAIIIDGFHQMMHDTKGFASRDAALCKVLAVLHDAVEWISNASGRPCILLVSEGTPSSGGEVSRPLHLMQRWIPLTLNTSSIGDGKCVLEMKDKQGAVIPAARRFRPVSIEYSLHSGLTVERINT